jgi:hypothetical protein
MASLPVHRDDAGWRLDTVQSLLWPRGWQLRANSHYTYNPFRQLPATDRLIAQRALDRQSRTVDIGPPNWRDALHAALKEHGTVLAFDAESNRARLKRRIAAIVSEPLEIGFMHVYPKVVGFEPSPHVGVMLEIEEAPQ